MSKFKVGDRVLRTGPSYGEIVKGGEYTVKAVSVTGGSALWIEGFDSICDEVYFEIIKSNSINSTRLEIELEIDTSEIDDALSDIRKALSALDAALENLQIKAKA